MSHEDYYERDTRRDQYEKRMERVAKYGPPTDEAIDHELRERLKMIADAAMAKAELYEDGTI